MHGVPELGSAVIDPGRPLDILDSLIFTFDGDTLSASVTGDITNSLGGSQTECTTSTPYIATSSTITTNPDTNFPTTFDYDISGNVLRLDFGSLGPHLTLVRTSIHDQLGRQPPAGPTFA